MTTHLLQIECNAEGHKLAYMAPLKKDGKPTCGFRIAGPKAWGGRHTLADIKMDDKDLVRYIKEYAPDVIKMLVDGHA